MVKSKRVSARVDESTYYTLKKCGITTAKALEIFAEGIKNKEERTLDSLDRQADICLEKIEQYDNLIIFYDELIENTQKHINALKKMWEEQKQ